jgi:biotin carboxylase
VAADPHGRPRLLVLGAGSAQLGLLEAARRRGAFVIAADRDPAALGFRYADRRALVSAEDESALERLADAERVDGVIAPGIDWPVAVAARIAERFGLPHPLDAATALLATSKLRQRERFTDSGVAQPDWRLCRGLEDVRAAADRLGYPCVLKAPDRQGQRGLGLVREPGEVDEAAAEALGASRTGTCLAEAYAPGRELTVNAFSVGGRFVPLTVTDRVVADPPAFGVALAHVWPSSLPADDVHAAVEAARAAAAALGIVEGPTYTQVLATADGARVVELAARLGGGNDADLCRSALGVDLNGLALAAALGEPIAPEALDARVRVGGACVRFLTAPPGLLDSVAGVEEAEGAPGIVWVRIYRAPGAVLVPLRRGADRAGSVLAAGNSREEALARADTAADLIRFDTADATAAV